MKPSALRVLSLPSLLFILAGCGAAPNSTGSANPTTNLNGAINWAFHIQDPGPGGVPPLGLFTGAVAVQGSTAAATLRATGATTCVAPTFDIQFTGTRDSQGILTLNSTNVPGNVITLTATPTNIALLGPNTFGSLTISGNGPCAFPNGVTALLGYEYGPLSGTYTGTLTATTGATATATLSQAAANTDGQFPESGSLTVATGSCSTTFALNGLVAGTNFNAALTSTSGSAATLTATLNNQSDSPVTVTLAVTGAGCANATYTGTLTAQP